MYRFKLALHVLRGRPLCYRMDFKRTVGTFDSSGGMTNAIVYECRALNPEPYAGPAIAMEAAAALRTGQP